MRDTIFLAIAAASALALITLDVNSAVAVALTISADTGVLGFIVTVWRDGTRDRVRASPGSR